MGMNRKRKMVHDELILIARSVFFFNFPIFMIILVP